MRIACWASVAALLALAGCTGDAGGDVAERPARDTATSAPAATPGAMPTVTARTEDGATRLDIRTAAGATHTLTVTRDSTVAPTAEPSPPALVGTLGDSVLVLSDTYASIPGGMSFCQAGEERFLRVIALTSGGARESHQTKLASCRTEIELAEEGLTWNPDSALVRVHWLTGPAGSTEVRTLHIAADGAVRVAKEE